MLLSGQTWCGVSAEGGFGCCRVLWFLGLDMYVWGLRCMGVLGC